MHNLFGWWFRFWILRTILNICKINFTVMSNKTNHIWAGWKCNIIDPPIVWDWQQLLSIAGHTCKRSRTISVKILIITGCNLDCSVEWAWNNNTTWRWIKSCANYWCLVNWFVWRFAYSVRNPEVVCGKISSNINTSWTGSNYEFVTSMVPSCIQVGSLFLDHTKLRHELVTFLLPNYYSSISRCTNEQMCDWMPLEWGNNIKMLFQNCYLCPLRNVRRTLRLKDPDLVVRWTYRYHWCITVPCKSLYSRINTISWRGLWFHFNLILFINLLYLFQ